MLPKFKNQLLHRIKIARGHFEKVIQMIESDEYCLKIADQTYAIHQALKRIDELLLENHLKTCVRESIETKKNVDEKVNEVVAVFKRKY